MSKIALVTGCNGGIGFSVAEKFLNSGYTVYGMDISDESKISHENFVYIKGNLACADDRKNFVNKASEKGKGIDILVNIAGVAPKVRTDILEMTEESYDFVMDINTKGTLFLTQLVANTMVAANKNESKERYIVNISSMSAYTSSTSRGEYCISKAGVSMITKLFADRLAEDGVMVNEIRPGIIKTGMTEKVQKKYDDLIDGGLLPIKRWGLPEDIAEAVYSLCSGALPYITGQSLDVDGGYHIHRL